MVFDPSIFKNISSRSLATRCCGSNGEEQISELTFTPELLYFDYILENEESGWQPFTVTNTGTLPVGITAISVTGDFEIQAPVLPVTLVPDQAIVLQIKFVPTDSGARLGTVLMEAGLGAEPCVHMIGIGGEDTFTLGLAALQAQMDAVLVVNATQTSRIEVLEGLLEGWVAETPVYMWRAYANSPDGYTTFTTGEPDNHSYIGLAFNKLVETPSENPDDYEWSLIGNIINNVISYDTTNVAGMPAEQLLADLDALSLQLLAYEFDQQQMQDYVDALLYVDGTPVNAEILTLQNLVETGDAALAETLDIMGAKSLDGQSFILDLNKVYVDGATSLGVRISNMISQIDDNQASVQDLSQAVATANYATVTDLSLLGAKTLDGTAWILDMSTLRVSESESFASYINDVVAAGFGDTASVTQLYEAVVTPDGGASAKAMVQLDVNGHVVGYSATNAADVGQMNFVFDQFNILHPGSFDPVFSVVGGVVKMTNVEVDTLKVNTVVTDHLQLGAVIERAFFHVSYGAGANGQTLGNPGLGTWAEFGLTGNKCKVVTPSLPVGTEVNIRPFVNKKRTGGSSDDVWYRLKKTSPGGGTSYVGDTVKSGMASYATVFTWEWQDTISVEGVHSYTLEYYRENGEGLYYSAKLLCDMGKR